MKNLLPPGGSFKRAQEKKGCLLLPNANKHICIALNFSSSANRWEQMVVAITLSKIELFSGVWKNSRLTSRFELTEHDSIVTEAREIVVFSAWSCQYQEE